jgi:hypothetical protein
MLRLPDRVPRRASTGRVHVSYWIYPPDTELVNKIPAGTKLSAYARQIFLDHIQQKDLLAQMAAELHALRKNQEMHNVMIQKLTDELTTLRQRFENALQ